MNEYWEAGRNIIVLNPIPILTTSSSWREYLLSLFSPLSTLPYSSSTYSSSYSSTFSLFHLIFFFFLLFILPNLFFALTKSEATTSSSENPSSPLIYCCDNKFNQKVKNTILTEIGNYHPPWWYNRHIVATIPFGRKFNLHYFEETFLHDDNSNFTVKWYPKKPSPSEIFRLCIFVPGLGSLSTDNYVTQFIRTICENGYYCLVITPRGHETPLNTHKVWHPAIIDDTIYILKYLTQRYPNSKIFLAGYSAGSNIIQNTLLTLLSLKLNIQICGVFCCCVNWCYSTTLKRLENSGSLSGLFYSSLLSLQVKSILSKTMHHIKAHHGEEVTRSLSRSHFISEIDHVTSKIYGFNSIEEMYQVYSGLKHYCSQTKKSSYQQPSSSICPILLLQPLDDPLHQDAVPQNIPIHEIQNHEDIILMKTRYGSHIGFVEGSLWEAYSSTSCYVYPAKVAVTFFNLIVSNQSKEQELRDL